MGCNVVYNVSLLNERETNVTKLQVTFNVTGIYGISYGYAWQSGETMQL